MHLVMFDIDGTLVDSVGFDADLYAQAVEGVLNIEIDRKWNAYEHVSDSGILEQLQHVGIDVAGIGFASSSDARARTDIMRLAAERALRGAPFKRSTYFGDGAWDQRASAELGYDFVAVGRGVPHPVAYDDFSDVEAILGHLRV